MWQFLACQFLVVLLLTDWSHGRENCNPVQPPFAGIQNAANGVGAALSRVDAVTSSDLSPNSKSDAEANNPFFTTAATLVDKRHLFWHALFAMSHDHKLPELLRRNAEEKIRFFPIPPAIPGPDAAPFVALLRNADSERRVISALEFCLENFRHPQFDLGLRIESLSALRDYSKKDETRKWLNPRIYSSIALRKNVLSELEAEVAESVLRNLPENQRVGPVQPKRGLHFYGAGSAFFSIEDLEISALTAAPDHPIFETAGLEELVEKVRKGVFQPTDKILLNLHTNGLQEVTGVDIWDGHRQLIAYALAGKKLLRDLPRNGLEILVDGRSAKGEFLRRVLSPVGVDLSRAPYWRELPDRMDRRWIFNREANRLEVGPTPNEELGTRFTPALTLGEVMARSLQSDGRPRVALLFKSKEPYFPSEAELARLARTVSEVLVMLPAQALPLDTEQAQVTQKLSEAIDKHNRGGGKPRLSLSGRLEDEFLGLFGWDHFIEQTKNRFQAKANPEVHFDDEEEVVRRLNALVDLVMKKPESEEATHEIAKEIKGLKAPDTVHKQSLRNGILSWIEQFYANLSPKDQDFELRFYGMLQVANGLFPEKDLFRYFVDPDGDPEQKARLKKQIKLETAGMKVLVQRYGQGTFKNLVALDLSELPQALNNFARSEAKEFIIIVRHGSRHFTPIFLRKTHQGMQVVVSDSAGAEVGWGWVENIAEAVRASGVKGPEFIIFSPRRQDDYVSCSVFALRDVLEHMKSSIFSFYDELLVKRPEGIKNVALGSIHPRIKTGMADFPMRRIDHYPDQWMKVVQDYQNLDAHEKCDEGIFAALLESLEKDKFETAGGKTKNFYSRRKFFKYGKMIIEKVLGGA